MPFEDNLILKTGQMSLVKEGGFEMGTSQNNTKTDSQPVHRVWVNAFYMDKTQVTNAQFSKFCLEVGYRSTAEKIGYGDIYVNGKWSWVKGACWHQPLGPGSDINSKMDHPVVLVTLGDAIAYCAWRSQKEGRLFRLPTEAEWEKGARGDTGSRYPWGNCDIDSGALIRACYNAGEAKGTMPAGSFPDGASPYGLLDMAGNVWEWCIDVYNDSYYAIAPGKDRGGPISLHRRSVFRGGSWIYPPESLVSTYRHKNRIARPSAGVGFRCVSPINESFSLWFRLAIRRAVHCVDKWNWRLNFNYPISTKLITGFFRKFQRILN